MACSLLESGRNSGACVVMSSFSGSDDDDQYWQCVKDLDGTLHAGGYPARAVVIEHVQGRYHVYKANLDPSRAVNLALSIARNESRNWFRIHCVNQKLKTRVDTISHEKCPECGDSPVVGLGYAPGYCPVCRPCNT